MSERSYPKTIVQIVLLVALTATVHGFSQSWLSKSVEPIAADNARLGRAATAALQISARPVGVVWQKPMNSIWLPALNSLLWGVALTGFAGIGLGLARKSGLLGKQGETYRDRLLKWHEILTRHHVFLPVVTLLFASAIGVSLVVARILWTENLRNGFLIWNLFLAWMPLFFALLTRGHFLRAGHRNWRFAAFAVAWLLFFPNAPYIFTDVIHLTRGGSHLFWVDLTLILICALTGFVLGFVSLYLMHSLIGRIYGWLTSWLFVVIVAGLSGFGVYLGRIVRLNSWDVVARPVKLYHGLNSWVADPLASLNTSAFPALFALFLFVAYVILYALTHLQPAQNVRDPGNATPAEA